MSQFWRDLLCRVPCRSRREPFPAAPWLRVVHQLSVIPGTAAPSLQPTCALPGSLRVFASFVAIF